MGKDLEQYPVEMSMYIMTFRRQLSWQIPLLNKDCENWDLGIGQNISKQQHI
jgi:hypothetical protein